MGVHIRLVLELLKKTCACFLICCCKDSIDRGNILNTLVCLLILILLEKENSQERLRILKVFIHAATMIVKKREMNGRKTRFLSFLDLMANPFVIQRLKKRKEQIGIMGDDIFIQKLSGQTL